MEPLIAIASSNEGKRSTIADWAKQLLDSTHITDDAHLVLLVLPDQGYTLPHSDEFRSGVRGIYTQLSGAQFSNDWLPHLKCYPESGLDQYQDATPIDMIVIGHLACGDALSFLYTGIHEIRHFYQRRHQTRAWAASSLLEEFWKNQKALNKAVPLQYFHLPHEQDAHRQAKKAVTNKFGSEAFIKFIKTAISNSPHEADREKYRFLSTLDVDSVYDWENEAVALLQGEWKNDGGVLSLMWEAFKKTIPECKDWEFHHLLSGS